jgi:hypothetical protein
LKYFLKFTLVYDLWKIINKKNHSWIDSVDNNLIYSYSDFLLIDFKNVKVIEMILFILFIYIYRKIFIVYIILVCVLVLIEKWVNIKKPTSLLILIFKNALISARILKKIKLINILNKKFIHNLIINLIFILIWGYPRFMIINSLFLFNYLFNWFKYSPKINIKNLKKKLYNLLLNNVEDQETKLKKILSLEELLKGLK